MEIKIKKVKQDAKIPLKVSKGSAGYDLFACIEQPYTLKSHTTFKVPTGIAVSMPRDDMVGLLFSRSSMGTNYNITIPNSVGVIDSDYRGEIFVSLHNFSDNDYTINPMDRIAQIVFLPIFSVDFNLVDSLDKTQRGEGGFGSSGKN